MSVLPEPARPDGLAPIEDPRALEADTIALVTSWLERAHSLDTASERRTSNRLRGVLTDASGVSFAMGFVDRVIRPERHRVAADQLASLVEGSPLPGFLSPIDRTLLSIGARLAPRIPGIVMPLAARRMRQLVGHLVVDADPERMQSHLEARKKEGFRLNVNLLGEAVLGAAEADRRSATGCPWPPASLPGRATVWRGFDWRRWFRSGPGP